MATLVLAQLFNPLLARDPFESTESRTDNVSIINPHVEMSIFGLAGS